MQISKIALIVSTTAIVIATAGVALADSPHFNSAGGSLASDGDLVISFKEAGLGSNMSISYLASADATASYGCINKGGNNPQATNKRTVGGPVTAPATFSSGKNGSISQSLHLEPPPPPADFSCPGGQNLVIAEVSYSKVSLKDTTTPVTSSIEGTFTKTFYTFK